MSFTLTRMFAYLTLAAYLTVGSVCVRVFMPEMTTISFSTAYTKLITPAALNDSLKVDVKAPEIAFNEIKIEEQKKVIKRSPVVAKVKAGVNKTKPQNFTYPKLAKNELNFNEPVVLEALDLEKMSPIVLTVNYEPFHFAETLIAKTETDEVTTKLAATASSEEPEFFTYETNNKNKEEKTEVAESTKGPEEVTVDDLVAFDYSVPEMERTSAKVVDQPVVEKKEESLMPAPVMAPILPMTTQKFPSTSPKVTEVKNDFKNFKEKKEAPKAQEANALMGFVDQDPTFSNEVSIQITGTDFKKAVKEYGFEVRFQDDLNESIQDYNSGVVNMNHELAQESMTRSITLLKRGYAPTNTDLILESGRTEATLPLIEEETLKNHLAAYEPRGPVGAVLVELGDSIDGVDIDVPYGKVITLDDQLRITTGNDYLYQLFVGVNAGNALLSYKDMNGDVISKIIHVHEQELTYESYFAVDVKSERVELFEEGLLGKEKIALGISSSNVVQFATTKKAQKLTTNKFKTDFKKTLLGGRKYLELTHQEEPVFVGYKSNSKLDIPSENFMRLILSNFEGSGLGNRCLIQVNLTKKAVKVDVGTESVQASVMPYVQMLDMDGKFYDSVGEKTTKVVVVGEAQGAPEISKDSKINFKISYEDGSEEFFGSYCSPNSYLVEQL